jgi:hypothetical protein
LWRPETKLLIDIETGSLNNRNSLLYYQVLEERYSGVGVIHSGVMEMSSLNWQIRK